MKCILPPINTAQRRFGARGLGALIHQGALLFLPLIHFAFALAPVFAQNAELSGLVSDPSGLAVPNARISVENANTGASRAVLSNQQGKFSVPALLPGQYNITVEASGFKTVHQNGVVVEVDQRARLDFALTIGSSAENITVQGTAPLLNTSMHR